MDPKFKVIDYTFLSLTLLLSFGVGVYQAIFNKQNTPKEYLHGGKNLNPYAIALSIVSSLLSATIMTALPADTYYYGIQYGFLQLPVAIITTLINYLWIMPIFYRFQTTSIFKYLELRFDSNVKKFSSFLYTIQIILYIPVTLYTAVLVFSQIVYNVPVTKFNSYVVIAVLSAIYLIYTIFGGIKAVIWTDVLQFCIMLGSIVGINVIGTMLVGGWKNVFDTSYSTGRLTMDFDLDMTKRDTFWAILNASVLRTLGLLGISQGPMQKFLSLKNYEDIKVSHILTCVGWMTLFALSTLSGIVMVAAYVFCDPLSTKQINRADQLIPYAVENLETALPGLKGLYVAGIISASLSSLSASLNSLGATLYSDFFEDVLRIQVSKQYETRVLKLIVFIVGILCTGLTYGVEHLGNIFPLVINILAITTSPNLGLFLCGLFIPLINSKGALYGGLSSLAVLIWLTTGSRWYQMNGRLKYPTLPVFTNSCSNASEISIARDNTVGVNNSDVPWPYRISHNNHQTIGVGLAVIVACVVSHMTKDKNQQNKDDYLSPLVDYFRGKSKRRYTKCIAVKDSERVDTLD